jgi:hypothetical protein
MEWCYLVRDGEMPIMEAIGPHKIESMAYSALKIAGVARRASTPWTLCKLQLEALWPVVGILDPRWLK